MEQSSKLSASVIAAAVVAMAGSVLFFLAGAAGLAGVLLMPPPSSPESLHPPNFTFFLHLGMYGGLLFSGAILVLLVYYRERFLQAVEARKLEQSPQVN